MTISAFPKIFTLGTRHTKGIFDGTVEITEKIDGSQFVFGKIDHRLVCRSRGQTLDIDSPEKMFAEGVEYVKTIVSRIPNNFIYYSEYLQKPKHNTIAYDRVPKNHIALFGLYCKDRDHWVGDYEALQIWSRVFGIDVVPLLGGGTDITTPLHELLDCQSYLGGHTVEGIVIKNYGMEQWVGGVLFPFTSAKYVSEKFKEKHQQVWKKEKTSKGVLEQLKDSLKSEARWEKAVQHLREDGTFEPDPRMIGALIKEVHLDIMAEEMDYIKSVLWKIFSREILKGSTVGLPEWFKEKLANGDFS